MDRRRLLLILAVFVALLGTALVFLYVRTVKNNAVAETDVLVATASISSSETYDSALAAGKLQMQSVPADYVAGIPGAVTSTDTLKGTVAATDLYQGQVVTSGQFTKDVASVETSSPLAIPKGMIAISVNLTDPDRVAGNIENGSNVAIFVTGTLDGTPGASSSGGSSDVQATKLLIPKVLVLNVGSPQQPTTSTTTDQTGTQTTTEQLPRTLLTIAVDQKDAQKVIVASKALNLTFGLLTSDSQIHPGPATSTLVTSLFR
jgi:pilus assembly protein CpaB